MQVQNARWPFLVLALVFVCLLVVCGFVLLVSQSFQQCFFGFVLLLLLLRLLWVIYCITIFKFFLFFTNIRIDHYQEKCNIQKEWEHPSHHYLEYPSRYVIVSYTIWLPHVRPVQQTLDLSDTSHRFMRPKEKKKTEPTFLDVKKCSTTQICFSIGRNMTTKLLYVKRLVCTNIWDSFFTSATDRTNFQTLILDYRNCGYKNTRWIFSRNFRYRIKNEMEMCKIPSCMQEWIMQPPLFWRDLYTESHCHDKFSLVRIPV